MEMYLGKMNVPKRGGDELLMKGSCFQVQQSNRVVGSMKKMKVGGGGDGGWHSVDIVITLMIFVMG